MELLHRLFPGIIDIDTNSIPSWENLETLWDIFGSSEFCLLEQIKEHSDREEGVFIDPSATIGEGVMIEGPCFIGAKVVIRHAAYIRKGSWISEGSLVGHCSEIKNSILLPGSNAPHFNYVGDSILGLGVNLGAGAKLSNVRNDRRSVILGLEDGSRVDSGLRKLGAMIGDGVQIGCNVVTNPGTIITPDSMIPPNKSVKGWI